MIRCSVIVLLKVSILCSYCFLGLTSSTAPSSSSSHQRKKLVIGIDGGTESIRACCFDALNGAIVGSPCAVAYKTHHPNPGWAEQEPSDWYSNLGRAVRGAIESLGPSHEQNYEVCSLCADTTCCSVVFLDDEYNPLCRSLLWMDARSSKQTEEILKKCSGEDALKVNCDGEGPISAEWMLPKSLWMHQNEPVLWKSSKVICEYQDYINYKLTGVMCASSCNAACRWHFNGEECLKDSTQDDKYPGRPMSLYEKLGIPELADKLPQKCLSMGQIVGQLTPDAAAHLNLPEGLPVTQGGPDAFVGMVGLGCVNPGQLCLITGSSHLHCVISSKATTAPGTWGAYRGAPLPGLNFAEGGQSSTGSIMRWAKNTIFGDSEVPYNTLDDEASKISPGCDGLVALETFQGSRTPITDPLARGALVGLTLSHTKYHIWRAFMEAVCYGTRASVEGLSNAGHACNEIIIAGGTTRSELWLQMHSDVTGKPVILCENIDAPMLGCAILASVGAGIHDSVNSAIQHMVRVSKRIEPQPAVAEQYTHLYENVYKKLSPSVRPIVHTIASLRGGSSNTLGNQMSVTRTGYRFDSKGRWGLLRKIQRGGGEENDAKENKVSSPAVSISPSLLACDFANIRNEVERCLDAGVTQLHIDIFDGVYLNSPHAFTFGPLIVEAISRSCVEYTTQSGDSRRAELVGSSFVDGKDKPENTNFASTKGATLDLHMCVVRPERFVGPMADAGGNRFIFQWEAMGGGDDSAVDDDNKDSESDLQQQRRRLGAAIRLARSIREAGMQCGVSINPSTDIEQIYPLLDTGLVSLIDILAVEPGFGGQKFQESILAKVEKIKLWRKANKNNLPEDLQIMVDGGVNTKTAKRIVKAGADVLVAGTFLFRHPISLNQGVQDLRNCLLSTNHL